MYTYLIVTIECIIPTRKYNHPPEDVARSIEPGTKDIYHDASNARGKGTPGN